MKPLMWSGILGAAAVVTALAFGADIIAAPRPVACNAHDIEHLSNEAMRTRIVVQMLHAWGATVTP